ncbi:MAG: tetratricopeptide repeat protein [Thaumarchaeota archaeon]|nr:tetratricopeptide repeat protein [Nitrososphaerota archaeon]
MDPTHTLEIPIVKEENICLPLVVSAVSKYWGVDLPLKEAAEIAKKYQNMKGSILIEGVELAERHGLAGIIINSTLKELKKMIDIGVPPIVILPGVKDVVQHASLIVGYDETEKTIFHYIPEPEKIGAIPEKIFDEQWQEDDRLMILLVPQDILPDIDTFDEKKIKSNRLCFDGEKLRLQGKTGEAMEKLRQALEINKSNSTAMCLLAGMLNDQNSSESVSYYNKTIALHSKYYLAYRGLGNYYLKTKDYPNAEKYYTLALEVDPTRFAPIYKNRGLVRYEQQKLGAAKQDFQKYLEQMPEAHDRTGIEQAISQL